jgi:uncharacterized protein (TIGR04255 family)
MNSTSSTVGNFEPIHDAHAVEQVQIAINFAQPLGDGSFSQVRQAMEVFRTELPGGSELQSFAIAFGQAPALFAGSPGQMLSKGFVMQSMARNGAIEAEVRIEPSSIAFRTTLYSRWNAVWDQFARYLKSIIGTYAGSPVMQVSLSFVDKFVWIGTPKSCKATLLLRPNSKYLCPHVYGSPDLWHSHTGAFIPVDEYTKRLLNINVDCLDEQIGEQARRIVSISTVLTDIFNQPGFTPLTLASNEAFDKLQERLIQLHDKSKHCFGDVISDEMCKRIALSREI